MEQPQVDRPMTLLICAAVAWVIAVLPILALARAAAQADRHHP